MARRVALWRQRHQQTDINDKWARSRSPFTTGPYAVHGALLASWPPPVRVVWYLVRQGRFFLFFHTNQRTVDHQHPSVAASVCCGVGGGSARLQDRVHKRGGLARLRAPRSAHKHPSMSPRHEGYRLQRAVNDPVRVPCAPQRRTQSPVADKTGTRRGASTYTYYRRNSCVG